MTDRLYPLPLLLCVLLIAGLNLAAKDCRWTCKQVSRGWAQGVCVCVCMCVCPGLWCGGPCRVKGLWVLACCAVRLQGACLFPGPVVACVDLRVRCIHFSVQGPCTHTLCTAHTLVQGVWRQSFGTLLDVIFLDTMPMVVGRLVRKLTIGANVRLHWGMCLLYQRCRCTGACGRVPTVRACVEVLCACAHPCVFVLLCMFVCVRALLCGRQASPCG